MDELSALAGSEGYEVCADDAQGVQPLVRSSATQRMTVRTGIPAPQDALLGNLVTPYRSAPFGSVFICVDSQINPCSLLFGLFVV